MTERNLRDVLADARAWYAADGDIIAPAAEAAGLLAELVVLLDFDDDAAADKEAHADMIEEATGERPDAPTTPYGQLTRGQRAVIQNLRTGRHGAEYPYIAANPRGDGLYSKRMLNSLVDAGWARWVHRAGLMPYVELVDFDA